MNTTSHNPESPLHIVFASDQRFLRQLTVASTSAVYASRASGGSICLHVLDCGIEDPSWTDYAALVDRVATKANVTVSLVRHRIDMTLFAKFGSWNGSKATWARLLIPDLLPDVDRCVYSDCDMLFIADPREMLDALDDPNILLAGHCDLLLSQPLDEIWCQKHGVEFDAATYLCAGLIAMNLSAFRAENLVEKCFAFATENPDVPSPDQTTLNRVCFGRKALLPDGWGLVAHECHAYDGRIKAIHYTGRSCWPWETCRTWHNVAWLATAKEECAIWLDFETRILGLSLPGATKLALSMRLLAIGVLLMMRLATRLGVKVGHGSFQAMLAMHDKNTPAVENAHREVFGDKQE